MKSKESDLNLIKNIKNDFKANESLAILIERHSGLYLDIANSIISDNNTIINKRDVLEDKNINIYKFALKFDETKGAKFSTHLGNETKWMLYNIYNKNKKRQKEDISEHCISEDSFIKSHIKNESIDVVFNTIKRLPDKRIEKIFTLRYIEGKENKVMPWKKVSEHLQMSVQGCINIHNQTINLLKESM